MTHQPILTAGAPAPIGPYSQAVRAGNIVYLSGQIALRPDGTPVEGGIREHTEQIFDNIEAVLAAAGLTLADVVKTTVFLTSMDSFGEMNEVYAARFGTCSPARSTVAVAGLPKGVPVEIEITACSAV